MAEIVNPLRQSQAASAAINVANVAVSRALLNVPPAGDAYQGDTHLVILAGSYLDEDDNVIDYEGINIDTVLLSVGFANELAITELTRGQGSVIEYVSRRNRVITASGNVHFSDKASMLRGIKALRRTLEVPDSLAHASDFLTAMGVERLVVDKFDISQVEGYEAMVVLSVDFIEDNEIDISFVE